MIEYRLKTPIDVSGNEIKKITLEEPDFDMISELGLPADVGNPTETMKLLKRYVARCSGLPDEAIGKIKVGDAVKLIELVTSFFTSSEA